MGAMDNVCEPTGTSEKNEVLEEARMESIAMVMRRRMLKWVGHMKRRDYSENIRTVDEMKMAEAP